MVLQEHPYSPSVLDAYCPGWLFSKAPNIQYARGEVLIGIPFGQNDPSVDDDWTIPMAVAAIQ